MRYFAYESLEASGRSCYVRILEADMAKQFFEERTDQSEVKARIVQKYFFAWANVIGPSARARNSKIAYIDLYAGPGRYKDGSASTPLLVLSHAIADPAMAKILVTIFNDQDKNLSSTLEKEIKQLPGIEKLAHEPHVQCGPVDDSVADFFTRTRLVPTFSFVDPFGYKGLSLKIVNGVIKDWGCDCVFFFNYNRINAGISNSKVDTHINALFGEERAERMRKMLPGLKPHEREVIILEELAQAIKALGGKFVLPFKFKAANGLRTSHSLIFVSKHFKGYEIMKDIMASESSSKDQGIASFSYSPATAATPLLFSLARPYEALLADLVSTYSGERLTMKEIYEDHSIDTPYTKRNYKDALLQLESEGKITATPAKRRAGTFADSVSVEFL